MDYDFDRIIDRSGCNDLKTGALKDHFGRDDLIPMWVADMDFATPSFITAAIRRRLDHPVLGYSTLPPEYYPALIAWQKRLYNWEIKKEWLSFIPGIVRGIGMVINAILREGDKVIIQPPVYHPFRLVPQHNHHEVVFNPLIRHEDGSYTMDFDHLARAADDKCRLLILSNPHNPGGISWDKETLQRLASFCAEHNIMVVSDEIHADMTLWGKQHIPFATVSDEAARISITLASPSKTFNLPGVVSSYAIVPDERLRRNFFSWVQANKFDLPPVFSPIAAIAALSDEGDAWRRAMLHYVEGNINFTLAYFKRHIPGIRPLKPDASFLIWLDCRALGLNHAELNRFFVDRAHLALNDGEMFNPGGEGFMRLNIACPRSVLEQALNQLADAVNSLTNNK